MYNCSNNSNSCQECGNPVTFLQNDGYTCDNCGGHICPTCWENMVSVHVVKPTKLGMTGFVKLCKHCRTRIENASVTPNPFIG
jgi:methionyl-tRNA synthetase